MGGEVREREQNVRGSEFWKVFASASHNLLEKINSIGLGYEPFHMRQRLSE